jgi:hypothetical protein
MDIESSINQKDGPRSKRTRKPNKKISGLEWSNDQAQLRLE